MRHALAIIVLAALVAAAGVWAPSFAQTAVRPRARPQAAPPASEPPAPTRAASSDVAAPERLTLRGLPRRFDAAPACRARCTEVRARCEAVDDACAPEWNVCLRRCSAA